MMDYTVTTEMTMTKVKAAMKATVIEDVISFLREKYGDDNVAMVRDKKKNTIGVRIGNIKDGTGEHEGCVTIDVSAKEYTNRKTPIKVRRKVIFFDEYSNIFSSKIILL